MSSSAEKKFYAFNFMKNETKELEFTSHFNYFLKSLSAKNAAPGIQDV